MANVIAGEIPVNINDACRGQVIGTIKITGRRRFNLRLSVSLWLIHLAAWVCPVGIDIEDGRD